MSAAPVRVYQALTAPGDRSIRLAEERVGTALHIGKALVHRLLAVHNGLELLVKDGLDLGVLIGDKDGLVKAGADGEVGLDGLLVEDAVGVFVKGIHNLALIEALPQGDPAAGGQGAIPPLMYQMVKSMHSWG